ncbi:MAG: hypothetical protein FWC62_05920 [Firmicutes bacterium]|nr:hypothetical protein [Bacillota bacterium]
MKKAMFMIVGILLLSIVLAACGGSGGASPSASPSAAPTATSSPSAAPTESAAPATTDTGTSDSSDPTLQSVVSQLQATFDGMSTDQVKYTIDLQGSNVVFTIQILAASTASAAGDPATFSSTYDSAAQSILSSIQQVSPSVTLTFTITAKDNTVIYTTNLG